MEGMAYMAALCGVSKDSMRKFLNNRPDAPAIKQDNGVWYFQEEFQTWWKENYVPLGLENKPGQVTSGKMMSITGMQKTTKILLTRTGLPHRRGEKAIYIDLKEAADWLIPQGGKRREWGEKLLAYKEQQEQQQGI